MSDCCSSAIWEISRIEPRLEDEQTQALSVVASAFDINRQELEKARRERSLCALYLLLKTKLGSHRKALSVIVWMLERIDYNDLTELRQHADYIRLDGDQIAREFRPVDFLLTVISVFRLIPEQEYRKIRIVVAENYLDGLSVDRVENRPNLVQRMYDRRLIHEEDCDLLYTLLERHGLNRYCTMLDDYCRRHLTCSQRNSLVGTQHLEEPGVAESCSNPAAGKLVLAGPSLLPGGLTGMVQADGPVPPSPSLTNSTREEEESNSTDSALLRKQASPLPKGSKESKDVCCFKRRRCVCFFCCSFGACVLIFVGLAGIIFSVRYPVSKNQTLSNSSSNSTQLEVGWNSLVLVSPDGIDLDSNSSVNVSSTEASVTFYRTLCNGSIVQALPWHRFPTINLLKLSTRPLNYFDFDIPLYTFSGVLHYECAVSSNDLATNITCGAEISLFDNVTHYNQSKNGNMATARERKCLEAGPVDSPAVTDITFRLQKSSFYYVAARVDVGFVVNCSANGTRSLYDSTGLIASNCVLGSGKTWCRFNVDKLMCILARSNTSKTLILTSNTTLVDTEVETVRNDQLFFSFLALSVFVVICGLIWMTVTISCMIFKCKNKHKR